MPVLKIDDHLEYLAKSRGLSQSTLDNYTYAKDRLGIQEIDTDNLSGLWTKLAELLPDVDAGTGRTLNGLPYGYLANFNGLVCGLLSLRNINYKSYEYNIFRERLGKLSAHSPEAYTDEQLRLILKESRTSKGFGLFRVLLFLTYSGCRISSAHGVKFSEMKEVPNYPKVLSVPLIGKGHRYTGIISKKAVEVMRFHNFSDLDLISGHKDTMKSSFAKYHRSLLIASIKRAGIFDVTENTDATRSIRKWFTLRLANHGIDSDSISLLLGHVPQSLAFKVYATAKGTTMEKLTQRVADAYCRSSLVDLEMW